MPPRHDACGSCLVVLAELYDEDRGRHEDVTARRHVCPTERIDDVAIGLQRSKVLAAFGGKLLVGVPAKQFWCGRGRHIQLLDRTVVVKKIKHVT